MKTQNIKVKLRDGEMGAYLAIPDRTPAGAIIASLGSAYVFVLNAVLSVISGFVIMRWRRTRRCCCSSAKPSRATTPRAARRPSSWRATARRRFAR